MGDRKEYNLIYPVGEGIFIHIYSDPDGGRPSYVPIEPGLTEDLSSVQPALEKRMSSVSGRLYEAESDEERTKALLGLVEKICVEGRNDSSSASSTSGKGRAKKGKKSGGVDSVQVTAQQLKALKYIMVRDKVGMSVMEPILHDRYIEDILRLVVTVTAETMHSKICSLWLIDDSDNTLKLRATQSISEDYLKERSLKMGEGIVGQVAAKREPRLVLNVLEEPDYKEKELAKKEGLVSMLSVPMVVKDRIVGVINCYTSYPHEFTETEQHVLITVANEAAVAIENTELMVKTKVIQEELEARKLIERASSLSLELNSFPFRRETLTVLNSVLELFPEDSNALTLLGMLHYSKSKKETGRQLWEAAIKAPNSWIWPVGVATASSGEPGETR